MPLRKVTTQPGVNQQWTQTLNSSSWWATNLIRFRDGMIEKIGGWSKLFTAALAGKARSLHAFEDLTTANNLLIGTDGGPQVYVGGQLYNFLVSTYSGYLNSSNLHFTSTSTSVTVTDTNYNPTPGQTVYLGGITYGGGGVVYPGFVTVATAPTGTTWTFVNTYTSNASANGSAPNFVSSNGTTATTVNITNHGLHNGGTFQVNYPVVWAQNSGGAIPAGNYLISGATTNSFTILATTPGTAGDNGTETPDGVHNMTVQYTASFPTPSGFVDWYTDNFGGTGLFSYTSGGIYQYSPPIATGAANGVLSLIANAPTLNNGMLVAMPQAQIIAWGTEPNIGSPIQDPLFLRWCDAGVITTWTTASTNQAGSFRLSRGSIIVGGIQSAITTYIWTDTDPD